MILLLPAPCPISGRRRARREGTDGSGLLAAENRCEQRAGLPSSLADDDPHRGPPYGPERGSPRAEEAAMGMMFRPRRPLMRVAAGAATATVAYKAGQRRTQQNQYNEQAQSAYAQTQAAPPQAAPAPAASGDSTAELERLAKLHESGALTDEEFAAAKSKLLGL